MKHRLATVLLALVAASAVAVSGAAANHGRNHARFAVHAARQAQHKQLYRFGGTLLATPGANATSVSLQVTTGNKPALRAMLGSAQNEVFDVSGSEILLWSQGVP